MLLLKEMKTQMSSADLRFSARELSEALCRARFDKAYQLGEKELKLRFYAQGTGSLDLIIAPNYVFLTLFQRKVPERPSSFAMQLRKNFEGACVAEVRQHGFDRILEIVLEKADKRFILVAELFSKGNVMLLNQEMKILGLLEWQRWKDRKLGVGQTYQYPPATNNPLETGAEGLAGILSSSSKKLASALATDAGLGGTLAEEACLRAGAGKERQANSLTKEEMKAVCGSFEEIVKRIEDAKPEPEILYEQGRMADVAPFHLQVHAGLEARRTESFNRALDEFFSAGEIEAAQKKADDAVQKELSRLREIEAKQDEIRERFEKEAVEKHAAGDLMFQEFQAVEEILSHVSSGRDKGRSWEDLDGALKGKRFGRFQVKSVGKDGKVTVEVLE